MVAFGDVEVDLTWRLVKKKGEEIKFTRAEYNLLTYFLKNPDRALWRSRYPELRPGPIRGLSAAEPAPFQTGPLLTYGHPDGIPNRVFTDAQVITREIGVTITATRASGLRLHFSSHLTTLKSAAANCFGSSIWP